MNLNNTVLIVNYLIKYAINNKASDIHLRDIYGKLSIQYRINGVLKEYKNNYSPLEIIARIKVISGMNVSNKRSSQDGSFSLDNLDFRVSCIPSISGESIVIRILNTYLDDISLKNLGFSDFQISNIENSLSHSNGLILVTGATGSGKSTTLMSLTKILIEKNLNIISIEDPVENKIDEIVQIQVNDDIGMSFSNILRSSLRADPDVIIISEIRDEITANIAIRASLTGHLVLATLHTNDIISSFNRLVDMKIPKYLLLDSLILIISQKLSTTRDNKRKLEAHSLLFTEEVKDIFYNNHNKNEIINLLSKISFDFI